MPIRRVVAKSLQCIVSFYLLIKLLCSRKGRKTSRSRQESIRAIEDQGALEAGNIYLNTGKRDSLITDREAPRRKGVYFLSTSTIADGDTPVIVPWRTTSETYGDPEAMSEKLSSRHSRLTSHPSSHDISLCSRSIYDDSSIIGLSLLFDSDEEGYVDEDTTYDFFQADLQEVFLGDPGSNWIQPVDSQWNLEVAAAMNAFRSSRLDHDDIVTSVVSPGRTSETLAPVKSGSDSVEAAQQQQIEHWRNDFIPEREANSSTPPSKDAAISGFRFP